MRPPLYVFFDPYAQARRTPNRMSRIKPMFLCAFCQDRIVDTEPIPCNGCRYMVYCCPAHRMRHWHSQHHQHCSAIAIECRIATEAAGLHAIANTPVAFKTLLQQFPRHYLSVRLYGYALLLEAARTSGSCQMWMEALNHLLAAEHHAMSGNLVRSTESGLSLYCDILYCAHHIQQCGAHAHSDMTPLIRRYKLKQQRFKDRAVSGLLHAERYSPEFTLWVMGSLGRLGLRTTKQDRTFDFWFKAYPVLRQLGFDRWSRVQKEDFIRGYAPSLFGETTPSTNTPMTPSPAVVTTSAS